jgi:hypothetical protein
MKDRSRILYGILLLALVALASCGGASGGSGDVPDVEQVLENPEYHTEIQVSGQVKGLGEVMCACFELVVGDQSITVWYDTIIDADGTPRPPVSVEGIENGDWVIVSGELNRPGEFTDLYDLWASEITKAR